MIYKLNIHNIDDILIENDKFIILIYFFFEIVLIVILQNDHFNFFDLVVNRYLFFNFWKNFLM